MANKLNGEVEIVLDKPRRLKLDFNALCEYEEAVGGEPLIHLMTRIDAAARDGPEKAAAVIGNRHVRALLYAALHSGDRSMTLDRAGALIEQAPGDMHIEKMSFVLGKLVETWLAAQHMGDKKKDDETMAASPPGT